jgi:hypothetical protein
MKNEQAKTRPVNNPYEIWVSTWQAGKWAWEWRVLKKYQTPEKEAQNEYARWFTAVRSPYVSSYEMGDTYVKDITTHAMKMSDEEMADYLEKPENKWRQF